jgi:nucleotide-binding universal stress UspA family protein
VTPTAVDLASLMARGERDEIFLVTVVPSELHQAQGQQLLARLAKQLSRCINQPRQDVKVKGCDGLLDCLEKYVLECDASVVVMGSKAISSVSHNGPAAAIGSVTLSCIRRLKLPMAIVTPQTRLLKSNDGSWRTGQPAGMGLSTPPRGGRSQGPRVMAVVEAHARGMLDYVCSTCLVSTSASMLKKCTFENFL